VDTELTDTGARLYVKLGIGELYKNLGGHFIVVLDRTILMTA